MKFTYLRWPYHASQFLASCSSKGHGIGYDVPILFECSYNGMIEIIVHELTHLQVIPHNLKFWEQLLVNLKRLEILDSRTSFDEFFVKQYDRNQAFWIGPRDSLICYSIFWANSIIMGKYGQQCIDTYQILRRNKVFDLKTAREQFTGERQPKEEYDCYVDLIENAYEDYKRITFHEVANGYLYYDTFHSFQYDYPSCIAK